MHRRRVDDLTKTGTAACADRSSALHIQASAECQVCKARYLVPGPIRENASLPITGILLPRSSLRPIEYTSRASLLRAYMLQPSTNMDIMSETNHGAKVCSRRRSQIDPRTLEMLWLARPHISYANHGIPQVMSSNRQERLSLLISVAFKPLPRYTPPTAAVPRPLATVEGLLIFGRVPLSKRKS
ncbi:hypothetical protein BP6252_12175 [Coleophoma cylindrospora]|uniref:Uncharacterized protein n=1 Tax=Coleophoma cylindrospora TaxID=1849047 RepID=A0A3D8QG38_9HELO|nr:hypothetical protein BP6252_12175 [Coleophoma cylindrospora]